MYLAANAIAESLSNLKDLHPFYGTTFLACKADDLPVGRAIPYAIAEVENRFINRFYHVDRNSAYFYTAFYTTRKSQRWLKLDKYADRTLQGTRTQSAFKNAFIHEKESQDWGWKVNYVDILHQNLNENKGPLKGKEIPLYYLATWLFRDVDWGDHPSRMDIRKRFFREFKISDAEQVLFDLAPPMFYADQNIFVEERPSQTSTRRLVGLPPDAEQETGGSLGSLHIKGVGPAGEVVIEAGERLNLFTGDNGLGKTFILETAWWALTGSWTNFDSIAQPDFTRPKKQPQISFQIASAASKPEEVRYQYDWQRLDWVTKERQRRTLAGLTIYARVDGSYAVWDPTSISVNTSMTSREHEILSRGTKDMVISPEVRHRRGMLSGIMSSPGQIVLDSTEVFLGGNNSEGLLRDWVKWQNSPDRYPFEILKNVLQKLSPPDMGAITPGRPQGSPFYRIEIPTIKHPYGEVPVTHVSAGIKRVLTLAYLIVWAWNLHLMAAERMRVKPQRRMVVLIDELEAHLHPHWQRTILPALLDLSSVISKELSVQFLISTHSPIVMASAEPAFDTETDKQFHLDLQADGTVIFEEKDFTRYGLIDYWLTSDIFELKQPRNVSAEEWLERANAMLIAESPSREEVAEITDGLKKSLPSIDPFWASWVYFADKLGVKV